MDVARVVEVLHDRGEAVSPRWSLGSGFIVKAGIVITAAHNLGDSSSQCGPYGTVVRTLEGVEQDASELARSDEVDLTLLSVPGLKADPVKIGRVNPQQPEVLRDVIAIGFPNYKYADERPTPLKRQPAQPFGFIPTSEGVSGGDLTLKIEAGEPAAPSGGVNSPWEGLSGAGVFVGEHLLAIVVEHHLSEGLGSLRLMPLTRILDQPGASGALFRAIIGVDDIQQFDLISAMAEEGKNEDPVHAALVKELQEVMDMGKQGLLTPAEVSSLKLTAYKEAKGWK